MTPNTSFLTSAAMLIGAGFALGLFVTSDLLRKPPADATAPSASTDNRPKASGVKLRNGDTIFNFGAIPPGEQARKIFTVHNDGDTPLIIHKAKTSCGCAAVHYDKTIPAHGQGQFEVALSGKNLKAGKIGHHIELETSDPEIWMFLIEGTVDDKLAKPKATTPQIDEPGLLIK